MDNKFDKYYTKPEVVDYCEELLSSVVDINSIVWVEPSAGSGAFLKDWVHLAFDIAPEHPNVIEQDFLKESFSGLTGSVSGLIGNPPFGKRNALSKQFIKHGVEQGFSYIAFVLPQVYNKHTLQKVFPPSWKLILNEELPKDSFTEYGKSFNIPSVFQVWTKQDTSSPCLRAKERKDFTCSDFSITLNKDEATAFVFGAALHKVVRPSEVNQNNRGYYLKSSLTFDELKSRIQSIDWKGNSSASGGSAWLTKTEFMNQYEERYGK